MSALASQWLIDTFIYTGLLIALVLLLRRPVSRYFGPTIAYALWVLPLLRFIMPPLVLPASMAPVQPGASETNAEPVIFMLTDPNAAEAYAAAMQKPEVGIAIYDALLAAWVIGALGFLIWRSREYLQMRRELLAQARPVGESGTVRLVETPAVISPVAFGIGDKVVALPPGFMAHYDRDARDLAIAHELAHHRGRDLLANILAQPVLALHWFNPLAWWGWRAMRRDQEAACDARVMAGRDRYERAAYAQVIAGFAANQHHSLDDLALAAPMACPVLGEKSIIHRLRSLSMTEISTRRRRFGLAILATSALVLPATASTTYAQSEVPEAPPAAPLPPEAPEAPLPPEPPAPPAPPGIESVDPDRHIGLHGEDTDRQAFVAAMLSQADLAQIEAEVAQDMARARAEIARGHAEMTRARAEAASAHAAATKSAAPHAVIQVSCDGEEAVFERELDNGRRAVVICQNAINDATIKSLRAAMGALSTERSIPAEARAEAVRQLQEVIEELEAASRQTAHSLQSSAPLGSSAHAQAQRITVSAQIRFAPRAPLRSATDSDCDAARITQQRGGLTV